MKYLLYCIIGYSDRNCAKNEERAHLYWFNPRMICTVEAYAAEKLAKIRMADTGCFWCDLGEWQSTIDKIHTEYRNPKDVRIQEVIVTK